MDRTVFDLITNLGGLVVLAGALLTGIVMTKTAHEAVLKERDRADAVRDARLEDQKEVNRQLTSALKEATEAFKQIADAWEARNRLEHELRLRQGQDS